MLGVKIRRSSLYLAGKSLPLGTFTGFILTLGTVVVGAVVVRISFRRPIFTRPGPLDGGVNFFATTVVVVAAVLTGFTLIGTLTIFVLDFDMILLGSKGGLEEGRMMEGGTVALCCCSNSCCLGGGT